MRSSGLALIGVVLSFGIAHADIDISKSDAAFEEGLKLKDAGKLDKACDKFKEALSYNPNAVGTMLNVAVCDEQTGHIASAYKRFKEARDRGREQNLGEQVKLAEQHIATLEPDMPYLAIAFAETTDDTKLLVNDEDIPVKDAGGIPVDPGPVTVVVTRPGHVPYEAKLTIEKKEHKAVAVPRLGLPITVSNKKRVGGEVVTAIGGVAIGTGVVMGIIARSRYNDQFSGSSPHCSKSTKICDPIGYKATTDALNLGDYGTIVGIAGVIVAGFGGYLWLSGAHQEKHPSAVTVVPDLDAQHAGIVAVGHF